MLPIFTKQYESLLGSRNGITASSYEEANELEDLLWQISRGISKKFPFSLAAKSILSSEDYALIAEHLYPKDYENKSIYKVRKLRDQFIKDRPAIFSIRIWQEIDPDFFLRQSVSFNIGKQILVDQIKYFALFENFEPI